MESFNLKFNVGPNAMIFQVSWMFWMYATASLLLEHYIIKYFIRLTGVGCFKAIVFLEP